MRATDLQISNIRIGDAVKFGAVADWSVLAKRSFAENTFTANYSAEDRWPLVEKCAHTYKRKLVPLEQQTRKNERTARFGQAQREVATETTGDTTKNQMEEEFRRLTIDEQQAGTRATDATGRATHAKETADANIALLQAPKKRLSVAGIHTAA